MTISLGTVQIHIMVFTGDLLDRGPGSRQVMDLIMRLEREAVRAGGQVHQLLGNHEVMNLIGDVRYVSDPEYAAFSEDESAEEREYWYRLFRRNQPADADEPMIRSEFNQKAPPGFFGYRRAFRGTALCNPLIEGDELIVALNKIGATRIVVGHSVTSTRRVQQRMNGRIIEIDTGMLKTSYEGSGNALILEDDLVTVANQHGAENLMPIAHPGGVGNRSETIPEKEAAQVAQ